MDKELLNPYRKDFMNSEAIDFTCYHHIPRLNIKDYQGNKEVATDLLSENDLYSGED